MALKKQEFYEGAALHILARTGKLTSIHYLLPFFIMNERIAVLLKYSTKVRSPWGFTFVQEEQVQMIQQALDRRIVLGLICGSDGIAAFNYEDYRQIASPRDSSIHIACYRDHGEQYRIAGPEGTLDFKVSHAGWRRILDEAESE